MEEEFEVVKSKGRRNPEPVQEEMKPECMILSEDELQVQANRMNWRKGTNHSVADLFSVQHGRPEFPKIFQNYRPAVVKKDTPFTGMKLKTASKNLKPETNVTEEQEKSVLDSLNFGALQIRQPEPVDKEDPPYAPKTP
jgi:hypothetical protein